MHNQERGGDSHKRLIEGLAADTATAAEAMREHLRLEMEASLNGLKLLFELQKEKPGTYSRTSKSWT